jgi:hypothetical protein
VSVSSFGQWNASVEGVIYAWGDDSEGVISDRCTGLRNLLKNAEPWDLERRIGDTFTLPIRYQSLLRHSRKTSFLLKSGRLTFSTKA